jgi:hypothetical protein
MRAGSLRAPSFAVLTCQDHFVIPVLNHFEE